MAIGGNNHEEFGEPAPGERLNSRSPRISDMRGIAVKGGITLAAVVLVVALLMMFSGSRSRARFVLADHEIQNISEEITSKSAYEAGSKVFFLINRRNGDSLKAGHFVIEIGREEGGKYGNFKQISYEIDKAFTKVSAYIPAEYFMTKGKYLVKSFLDGKPVTSDEILIQ